jgi:hypothetical protein
MRRSSPSTFWLPLAVAAIHLVAQPIAWAQSESDDPEPSMSRRTVLFVPSLSGEVFGAAGVQSRLPVSDPNRLVLPTTTALAHLGYRKYLDDRGQFGIGLYANGGVSLPDSAAPAAGRATAIGGGLTFQFRAMNPDFIYLTFGSFVEASALTWKDQPPPQLPDIPAPHEEGFRLAVGIESGPGLLWYLDPTLFGESTVQFGMEFVKMGQAELTSILIGWKLVLERVVR